MSRKTKDYAAKYFFIANKIIETKLPEHIVYMQFFQRQDDVKLCGIKEVLKFLEENTDTSKYKIKYLKEGSIINAMEPVLVLEGKYKYFGVYEGMIDGILARNTSITTNAYRCVKAAPKKDIVYMGDRADHYINQEIDGYAVEVGGIVGHSTLAGSRGNEKVVFGSIPHVLIQHYNGNVLQAMKDYYEIYPEEEDLVGLVDYNNDVIKDSLALVKEFGTNLKGVRVDTSMSVSDHMFDNEEPRYGVNVEQIKRLRKALDENGGKHVRIIVSSGFNPDRIKQFENEKAPVDAYGVGEYILKINNYFSADAVKINDKLAAKKGRKFIDNKKLLNYN